MTGSTRTRRIFATLCAATLITGQAGMARAFGDPDLPPPRPVLGPLEYGPPAYPPGVGVPLLPRARPGAIATADSVSPVPQRPRPPIGVAGVGIEADTLTPAPFAPPPIPASAPPGAGARTPTPLLPYTRADAGIAGVGIGSDSGIAGVNVRADTVTPTPPAPMSGGTGPMAPASPVPNYPNGIVGVGATADTAPPVPSIPNYPNGIVGVGPAPVIPAPPALGEPNGG